MPLTKDCDSGESGSPAPEAGLALLEPGETRVDEPGAAERGWVAGLRVSNAASETRWRSDADAAAPPLLSRRSAVLPAAGFASARGLAGTGSAGRIDPVRARAVGRSLSPGGVVESVTAPCPFEYDS
jgi:hypothetical protein